MVFSLIGIILHFFTLFFSFFLFTNAKESSELKKLVGDFLNEENIKEVNVNQVINFVNYISIYLSIISIICILLGLFAIILLRGNKNPKKAGKTLIITAMLGTISTIFIGFLGSIVYLIAGIITLVRKPKSLSN